MHSIRRSLLALTAVFALMSSPIAEAQTTPFVGQVMCGAWNMVPRGWVPMNGQLLSISQNEVLFSLLGTNYGGDGVQTFALPDMRGRAIIQSGQGFGLTDRPLGSKGGSESIRLSASQLPPHSHVVAMPAAAASGTSSQPGGNVMAVAKSKIYGTAGSGTSTMAPATTSSTGSGAPAPTMSPYVTMTCLIAVEGVYPTP